MSVVVEKCGCSLCDLYQGIPKITFAGRKIVKTDEVQKGWRQSMDLIREQSKIIHTSREIIAEYQDHLSVCFTKSIDECIICRDLFSSLESCLMAGNDQTEKPNKQELAIQQSLRDLFKTDKLCISIFFDNPQLSKTVSSQEGMEIILETFVTKTMVKILFGRIVYGGEYDPTIPCVSTSKVRGGDVIVAEVVELISADLSKFPSRMVDGIKELQLRGVNSPDIQRTTGEITYQDIEAFFGPCTSRVDVILDPIQRDNHKYYPYYEGTRKMAPQFRSRGIGYVRLGDDMSNFGTAFLSVDHGRTFLDRGANDRNIMRHDAYESDTRAGSANGFVGKSLVDAGKNSTTTLRANTEFSRSMPLMNKNVNSQSSLPPSATVYIAPPLSLAPPPLMRATSAGTCGGSVVSYNTVPSSAVPVFSPSPSPMPSSQKKKLTESLRRIISVNRSQSDLQVQVPGIQTVDTSYVDDDEDDATSASNGLPTPKQLLPTSPSAQQLEEAMTLFETSMGQEGSSAWRAKVEVVKRLQSDFELVSIQIAESIRSQAALRLLDVLREQLGRTQNPQLTLALLELLPVLASRLKVNFNADLAVNLSWRRVLTEMIQLLRNNNRQIEMGATRFMVAMTQVGPRALTWPLLCDILEPILGLPVYSAMMGSASATMIGGASGSTKQSSSGTSASTSKSLGKLNKVMEFIDQWLVNEMSTILSKGCSATFSAEELLRLTRVALVAVKDRDEKSRTSGMQLIASIGIADVLLNSNNKISSLDLSSILAGVSSWLLDELDRANLPRSKLTSFFAKTIEALPNGDSNNSNTTTTESNVTSSSGSGKISGGFSASLKARKLTQPSSLMKATSGSNPQPPSGHNASFTLVEKPKGDHNPPLGSKMMHLRLQEAQLLLKREPQSHAEWLEVQEVIEMSDIACTHIEHLSKQYQVPLGSVLRVLLPFTEQTSTLDQTISVVGGDWRTQVQADLRSQLPQLASMEAEFISYSETLRTLRGIVRVKIADQSDFRQARAAVHTLKDFLQDFTVEKS